MVKRTLNIDLASLQEFEPEITKVKEVIERETPAIKQGFRKVESEVETAVRTIFDKLAGDDEEDEQRDILGKLLG